MKTQNKKLIEEKKKLSAKLFESENKVESLHKASCALRKESNSLIHSMKN